jgi:hypothetical protein
MAAAEVRADVVVAACRVDHVAADDLGGDLVSVLAKV